jgi:hypothetical protein
MDDWLSSLRDIKPGASSPDRHEASSAADHHRRLQVDEHEFPRSMSFLP